MTETVEADPYVTLDVRLGQGLGEHFSLFVGVENILDAGDPVYLAIEPRNFYGGINARL